MNTIVPSHLARKAVAVGFKNHWRFRVVSEASYKKDWRTETTLEAPRTALKRLEALKSAGIPFGSFIVAHEAPRLLTAPTHIPVRENSPQTAVFPIIAILVFVFSFFFQAVLLDPVLIVVLEDGTWLEVMTWYE